MQPDLSKLILQQGSVLWARGSLEQVLQLLGSRFEALALCTAVQGVRQQAAVHLPQGPHSKEVCSSLLVRADSAVLSLVLCFFRAPLLSGPLFFAMNLYASLCAPVKPAGWLAMCSAVSRYCPFSQSATRKHSTMVRMLGSCAAHAEGLQAPTSLG